MNFPAIKRPSAKREHAKAAQRKMEEAFDILLAGDKKNVRETAAIFHRIADKVFLASHKRESEREFFKGCKKLITRSVLL